MKKAKLVINNKMKPFGRMDTKTNVVEINKKKHKGDRRELADTIKHELTHVKHPKMTEKQVQKKTAPELSRAEQDRLIAKLRMKKINYQMGTMKRKFKMGKGDFAPGELINKMQAQKTTRSKEEASMPTKEKVAIMGLI